MNALVFIGWVVSVGLAFTAGCLVGVNAPTDPDENDLLREQLERAHADQRALIDERDRIAARLTAISGSLRGGLS